MPTYQYACTACGHQLEAVQSFSDDPLTDCPECEGRLRKLYSAVGIVFKGSGFYRTDSRNGGKSGGSSAPAEKSESKSESKTETKTETKSETKSATKSDSSSKSPAPAA